ncbi:MAG: hypothetical protein AAGJ87_07255 [Pseudomonadota bacterium]
MTDPDFKPILEDVYAMLSGPPGPRDYDRVRHYYHPDARLIRTGMTEEGEFFAQVMSLDDHARDVNALLSDTAFVEEEIAHEAEVFGSVARVTSIYRYCFGDGHGAEAGRGVNLYSFYFDGETWKAIACVWANEREGFSLNDALRVVGV